MFENKNKSRKSKVRLDYICTLDGTVLQNSCKADNQGNGLHPI